MKKDNDGKTALHGAAQYNSKETAELLLSHDININEKDNDGKTAFDIAASMNKREINDYLISYGAKL
ncbi:ankyrin repeat protein, putative [Trichomonas vaginalis G3]|uniref:Ankyrin repeat protein, putative n=1 Tax=Trichomonas vaginalis (strain ATCC PRA-98 / G3) TaxID=412133 RepID=A2F4Y0_TRIV3|nr:proteasome regulatory particle assembly [Trichomonas vaginalis G3]EAY00045.1 ankyrin repeat protein, putative [Trichomonas vaginalis G3]KAI5483110.1 proteasome regulatory particle assembly [Trichomonas vaginalis G3]|eukprot:XP_001312974.1 ankyrin repeat protein [Trichomonas vaginalis G3]